MNTPISLMEMAINGKAPTPEELDKIITKRQQAFHFEIEKFKECAANLLFESTFVENRIECPFCDAVPHLISAEVGTLEQSSSGKSLVLKYGCEEGHKFEIHTVDHSGCTSIYVRNCQ